jgi:hypothetical protein
MSYPVSQLYNVPVPNGTLTAANYNAEFQNVYLNVGKPENIDDFSDNLSEMQIQTDPGEVGTESQAITLSGEIERLRFAIKEVKQTIDPTVTYWYETPGTLNLGTMANTDTFTIYAQNELFTETVLTLKCDKAANSDYKFLDLFSDANGTISTRLSIDGLGNIVTLGSITTTGQLIVLDIPGVKADKLILSEAGTGVNHITLQGPDSASTTTHVITLPGALPSVSSFMMIDQTGQVSYSSVATMADTIAGAMTPTGADLIAADMSQTGANSIATVMGTAGANLILSNATNLGTVYNVQASSDTNLPYLDTPYVAVTMTMSVAGTYLFFATATATSGGSYTLRTFGIYGELINQTTGSGIADAPKYIDGGVFYSTSSNGELWSGFQCFGVATVAVNDVIALRVRKGGQTSQNTSLEHTWAGGCKIKAIRLK